MKAVFVGLAALSLALGAGVAASAQTPAAPMAAAPGKPSVETTTIGDLLANPATKAVLVKDYPDLIAYPGLDQIKGLTLRGISAYPEAKLDDARLASLQKHFDAVTAP